MSRLVRALLGLPKPKGNDEREPDDDDPPWPDVTVVVSPEVLKEEYRLGIKKTTSSAPAAPTGRTRA